MKNFKEFVIEILTQKEYDGKKEWVLLSKDKSKVLRRYGKNKPSKETIAQDEKEIHFFSDVLPHSPDRS